MGKRLGSKSKTDSKTVATAIRPVEGSLVKAEDGRTLIVTERGIGAVEAATTAGVSGDGIAALLGCSREALRKARERQPELDAALSRGLASLEAELVGHLLTAARKGQFVPAMFLLKTRFGYREGDAPESKPSVVINLPSPLSPQQYLDMLEKRQRAVIEGEKPDVKPSVSITR